MKLIIILGLFAAAVAAPQQGSGDAAAEILKYDSDINPDGSFQYSFDTSNGIHADAKGALRNIGAEEPALQIIGNSQYTDKDGQVIELTYTADENGFQPKGSHIPTAPPIPEAIEKALAYLATAPPQPEEKKGKF